MNTFILVVVAAVLLVAMRRAGFAVATVMQQSSLPLGALENRILLCHALGMTLDDVAGAVGVDVDDLAGGVALEDFDHDGFLDLMVSAASDGWPIFISALKNQFSSLRRCSGLSTDSSFSRSSTMTRSGRQLP